jgi:hypothetical protein
MRNLATNHEREKVKQGDEVATYYDKQKRIDQTAIYCLGRIEQYIEDYAKSSKISPDVLTYRVAEFLFTQARGTLLGTDDSMSPLRRNSATHGPSVAEMALAGSPHSRAQTEISRAKNRREHIKHLEKTIVGLKKSIKQRKDSAGRTISAKALRAMRINAVKARAALARKHATKR